MEEFHGTSMEEFHGTSMEESDKAEFWLEKLEKALDEVRCPVDQRPHVQCHCSKVQLMIGGSWF